MSRQIQVRRFHAYSNGPWEWRVIHHRQKGNSRVFQTAALFMLGMLMGRQGWLLESRLKNWAQVLGWALVAYFPLTGLTTLLPGFIDNENVVRPLLLILTSLSKFCFMLVLVSGILYLW